MKTSHTEPDSVFLERERCPLIPSQVLSREGAYPSRKDTQSGRGDKEAGESGGVHWREGSLSEHRLMLGGKGCEEIEGNAMMNRTSTQSCTFPLL